LLIDPDGEGPAERAIARAGDHSWFVVLVGKGKPQYAIATVMEYAGSGAKVSGPIINQVITALSIEGYFTN
jgi:cell division protein FtsI/penicillin-binding protein 2